MQRQSKQESEEGWGRGGREREGRRRIAGHEEGKGERAERSGCRSGRERTYLERAVSGSEFRRHQWLACHISMLQSWFSPEALSMGARHASEYAGQILECY
eukprot:766270-Hanusia_phi.AAC.4